jgi:MerR family transcriptional regulator, light-induced transcriptional regulator
MAGDGEVTGMRIGELSRRVGLSDHVLRAWENRYRLLEPVRSPGGFRLYSEDDERSVRLMQAHIERGLSPTQAAVAALAEHAASSPSRSGRPAELPRLATELRAALDRYDEPTAQSLLDRLLDRFPVETALVEVLLPYLRELGDRWASGEVSVAQEHYASNLVRGRLANLGQGWGRPDEGGEPAGHAVLAAPPGELHDLALMAFGVVLGRLGWRISFVGADTPAADLLAFVEDLHPDVVVLAATTRDRFTESRRELAAIARLVPVAVAGPGADEAVARELGGLLLSGDPVTAARELAANRPATPAATRPAAPQ